MKRIIKILLLTALIATLPLTVTAKNVENKVSFLKGSDQATLTGKFQGYDDVRYRVFAKSGQVLKFNINSYSNLAYVNVFAPGKKPGKDKALLVGSTMGSSGELVLPVDGDYIIQVYQMRNSARKNRTVSFSLDLQILNNKNIK
ncbi:DNA breaking-rejoining protein [Acinetobacter sp. ABJ_C1_1]|uniref:DNA breaking-rejoining protein n=1 Tax=Acinetobacter sp. ABJ_C1_1 TaxID=3378321 RepID=UPI0037DC291E